ncbi:DUF456 domain-containing protein [Streptomyces luteolus]|uniref:DUF456 domain-containing protein n=1 Tax=Streptomyces luteolus TaxID=3043615 RepID=A0ABT6SUV5_9ACTN|nr:DUF456 domain-containing protein [Streptomyces sp. B-S-A12]MDI3419392.1 DUF456 domain-containing protein [Streptomyces sp. B-S-A12]
MGVWELLLVGAVLLLGLCGVLIPGVPGSLLVWGGVAWWALLDQSGVAWGLLVGATALLLLQQAIRWRLPQRRIQGVGITRRMVVCAGLGALVGFVVVPVIGSVPGFIGGVYLTERLRLGSHGAAWSSTRAAMRAIGTSVLVELFACLLSVGAWVGVLIWG